MFSRTCILVLFLFCVPVNYAAANIFHIAVRKMDSDSIVFLLDNTPSTKLKFLLSELEDPEDETSSSVLYLAYRFFYLARENAEDLSAWEAIISALEENGAELQEGEQAIVDEQLGVTEGGVVGGAPPPDEFEFATVSPVLLDEPESGPEPEEAKEVGLETILEDWAGEQEAQAEEAGQRQRFRLIDYTTLARQALVGLMVAAAEAVAPADRLLPQDGHAQSQAAQHHEVNRAFAEDLSPPAGVMVWDTDSSEDDEDDDEDCDGCCSSLCCLGGFSSRQVTPEYR